MAQSDDITHWPAVNTGGAAGNSNGARFHTGTSCNLSNNSDRGRQVYDALCHVLSFEEDRAEDLQEVFVEPCQSQKIQK